MNYCIIALCVLLNPNKPTCDQTKSQAFIETTVDYHWQCERWFQQTALSMRGSWLRPTRFEHGDR